MAKPFAFLETVPRSLDLSLRATGSHRRMLVREGSGYGAVFASRRDDSGFWAARVDVRGSVRGMPRSVGGDTGTVSAKRVAEKTVAPERDLRGRMDGPGAELAWQAVGLVDDTWVTLSHLQRA